MAARRLDGTMPELPDEFLREMQSLLGNDLYAVFADNIDADAEVSVRINPHKGDSGLFDDEADGSPIWWSRGCYLKERPSFTLMPEFHGGSFYVQEASSMVYGYIIDKLFGGKTPMKAADLCAAPGGKTTIAMDALPKGSVMLANEFVASRAAVLRENVMKWANPGVVVTNAPTSKLRKALPGYFDLVIVDAPCSGEGMMRKEAEARHQWSHSLINQCVALQREILADAVDILKPGGVIIYSTCTFNKHEDEEQARYLRDEFGMQPIKMNFPDESGVLPGFDDEIPSYRFIPGITRGEGLFVCIMQKPGGDPVIVKPQSLKEAKGGRDIKKWLKNADEYVIIEKQDKFYALPSALTTVYKNLEKENVKILTAGIEIGELKGHKVVPSHGLALSNECAEGFAEVSLDKKQALNYLRGEAMMLSPEIQRGFVKVKYGDISLGWVNNLGSRANNLYPAPWRIKNL